MADTVQGYCSVDIASGFPLSAVNMIIENASEVFTKIELKYYTCLFRGDFMDEIVLLVKNVANKCGKHKKDRSVYAGESSEESFLESE